MNRNLYPMSLTIFKVQNYECMPSEYRCRCSDYHGSVTGIILLVSHKSEYLNFGVSTNISKSDIWTTH